jgi:hypothetical protein
MAPAASLRRAAAERAAFCGTARASASWRGGGTRPLPIYAHIFLVFFGFFLFFVFFISGMETLCVRQTRLKCPHGIGTRNTPSASPHPVPVLSILFQHAQCVPTSCTCSVYPVSTLPVRPQILYLFCLSFFNMPSAGRALARRGPTQAVRRMHSLSLHAPFVKYTNGHAGRAALSHIRSLLTTACREPLVGRLQSRPRCIGTHLTRVRTLSFLHPHSC